MFKFIGDLYYKVSGLQDVQASLGYAVKSVMSASFPRYHIVIYYSTFCQDSIYIIALTHCLAYKQNCAYDALTDIKSSGEGGYIAFSGNAEITEHRAELLDALREREHADSFRFEVRELN